MAPRINKDMSERLAALMAQMRTDPDFFKKAQHHTAIHGVLDMAIMSLQYFAEHYVQTTDGSEDLIAGGALDRMLVPLIAIDTFIHLTPIAELHAFEARFVEMVQAALHAIEKEPAIGAMKQRRIDMRKAGTDAQVAVDQLFKNATKGTARIATSRR